MKFSIVATLLTLSVGAFAAPASQASQEQQLVTSIEQKLSQTLTQVKQKTGNVGDVTKQVSSNSVTKADGLGSITGELGGVSDLLKEVLGVVDGLGLGNGLGLKRRQSTPDLGGLESTLGGLVNTVTTTVNDVLQALGLSLNDLPVANELGLNLNNLLGTTQNKVGGDLLKGVTDEVSSVVNGLGLNLGDLGLTSLGL